MEREETRVEKLRYIHRNPVRRGLVEKPDTPHFEERTPITRCLGRATRRLLRGQRCCRAWQPGVEACKGIAPGETHRCYRVE